MRMLGEGRPFALMLSDPKRTKPIDAATAASVEASVTASGCVQVDHLEVLPKYAPHALFAHPLTRTTSREALQILKDGEASKRKTYTCIVRCSRPVPDAALERLTGLTEVVLEQATPLRVLHRRSPATRNRTIHALRARRLSDTYLRVLLTTQAGTYVKEFVHGDLGRTRPALSELLEPGSDLVTDLIELDVIAVQLPWPPSPEAIERVTQEIKANGGKPTQKRFIDSDDED